MIIIQGYMLLCGLIVLVYVPIHSIISHKKKEKKVNEHLKKYLRRDND